MKKNLIYLVPLLLVLSNCSDKLTKFDSDINQYSNQKLIKSFTIIGELHNEGLDSIYYGLSKLKKQKKLESKDFNKFIDSATCKFISKKLHVESVAPEYYISKLNEIWNLKLKKGIKSDFDYVHLANLEETKTSVLLKELLVELTELMQKDTSKHIYDSFLEENITKLGSVEDKIQLIAGVSIAYNSLKYWNKNVYEWNVLLNDDNNSTDNNKLVLAAKDLQKAAKNIAVADVTGVIYGGVSGCVFGAVGGTVTLPGIGTVAGCAGVGTLSALTMGLGESAKSAVQSLFDSLF